MTMVSHGSSELFEMSKYLMLGALLTALIQTFVAQDSLSSHRTGRLHVTCVHDGLRLPALLMLHDRCLRSGLLRQVILTWLLARIPCIRPYDRREEHADDAFDFQGPFCIDTLSIVVAITVLRSCYSCISSLAINDEAMAHLSAFAQVRYHPKCP